ncbi:MAG: head-tail connector protein [Gammaproteobacteria bacterium]|nr:head-tail connector protein [Gammaproteobacteria bacterium]
MPVHIDKTQIDYFYSTLSALKSDRQSHEGHWQNIANKLLPYRSRFFVGDHNKGGDRFQQIINNKATTALKTLGAGLMTGITSPFRPWFKLSTQNPDLLESAEVKIWLERVEFILRQIMIKSNFYDAIQNVYYELGQFGTASLMIVPDFDKIIHCYAFTAGEYYIGKNHKGQIDTHYRVFPQTIRNIVDRFGLENTSKSVQAAYASGKYNGVRNIVHVLEPRKDRDSSSPDARHKPFRSVYFEEGKENEGVLSDSGFDLFPCMVPRWDLTGQDVYATGWPAAEAYGDNNQLQSMEKSTGEGIQKLLRPNLQAPTEMKKSLISGMAGGVNFTPDGKGEIRTTYDVNPAGVNYLMNDISRVEKRISRAFYEDLFMTMSNMNRAQITAREIDELHEEKLLMIGPVLSRLNTDLYDSGIAQIYYYADEAGILPDPPKELEEEDLKIEYVSILAQAQQATNLSKTDQFMGFAERTAKVDPSVLDNINFDKAVQNYGRDIGVAADILKSENEIAEQRQKRAQEQQQQQAMESIPAISGAVKDLSQAQVGENNIVEQIIGL